uniref:Protein kinase domain-containing protein n=1 Tax=Sander lucioperca TaxID=283035 RepID=A0A8D0D452_SANLU
MILPYIYDIYFSFSRYEFLQDLGEGSFGKVVKCWNKDTKQTVAPIDFGLAMPRSEARQGMTLQTLCFR